MGSSQQLALFELPGINLSKSDLDLERPPGPFEGCHLTHHRDVFNAWMLEELELSNTWELPLLQAVQARPRALVPFSVAMGKGICDYGCFVHFFEDDYRFESLWKRPKAYLPKLKRFAGVIMPDFSTCIDFAKAQKIGNAYRNQLLGAWLQKEGLTVLPNARHQPGCDFLLEALPKHSTIAICGRALVKDVDERRRFVRDLRTTVDALEPTAIVYYGSEAYGVLDYPRALGIPVGVYHCQGCGQMVGVCHGKW